MADREPRDPPAKGGQPPSTDALPTRGQPLEIVNLALSAFLVNRDWREASSILLRGSLELTGSEHGFLGFLLEGPVFRILAFDGLNWDASVGRNLYEIALRVIRERGYYDFNDLDSLFGHVLTASEPVVTNDPLAHPAAQGLPPGHPPLRSFLGVPMRAEGRVVGMIGLANRAGGYGDEQLQQLELFCRMASMLALGYRREMAEEAGRAGEQQRAKMEALRRVVESLAGEVAALDAIRERAERACEWMEEGDPHREDFATVAEDAARVARRIRRLRTFAQPVGSIPVGLLDPAVVIQDFHELLERMSGPDVALMLDCPLGLGRVRADPEHLEEILARLVENAREAMDGAGTLRVGLFRESLGQDGSVVYAHSGERIPPGDYLVLDVRDSGRGMTPEVVQHVFEPFFTTHAREEGRGMGLPAVHGVVRALGGHATIESWPGRGTDFRLRLPRHGDA